MKTILILKCPQKERQRHKKSSSWVNAKHFAVKVAPFICGKVTDSGKYFIVCNAESVSDRYLPGDGCPFGGVWVTGADPGFGHGG